MFLSISFIKWSSTLNLYLDEFLTDYIRYADKLSHPVPYLKLLYPDKTYRFSETYEPYEYMEYSLDLADLRQRYLSLQKKIHPDTFSQSKIQIAQSNLERISGLIAEGYFNLRDPVKRAEHWLCMHQTYGKHSGCNACALSCDKKFAVDLDFLQELMEIHEEIDRGEIWKANKLQLKKKEIVASLPSLVHSRHWDRLAEALSRYRYLDALTSRINHNNL